MRFIVPISVLTAVSGTATDREFTTADVQIRAYHAACQQICDGVPACAASGKGSHCEMNVVRDTALCQGLYHDHNGVGFESFHYHTSTSPGSQKDPATCVYALEFARHLAAESANASTGQ